MVIDLDRFKQVNDALGHRAGDAVLREAAHRIAGCVRKADTLARHGGDEFVVRDRRTCSRTTTARSSPRRSCARWSRRSSSTGASSRIGASIGLSLFPADAGDGEALLRNADVAMYRAKQLGRNNYRFYGARCSGRVQAMRHAWLRFARFILPYRLKIAVAIVALLVAAGCVLAHRAGAQVRGRPGLRQRQPGTAERGARRRCSASPRCSRSRPSRAST